MSSIVVGIDPDSDKHGVAIYIDNKLCELKMCSTIEMVDFARLYPASLFSIEDVCANNFVYARNRHGSKNAQSAIAMRIGRCQQAQTELMRWLDSLGVAYKLHKPQKGNWAENRPQFEKVTGWDKQSNADTRAAAYFGYLALSRMPVTT